MQICSNCGININSDSKFCSECGNNLVAKAGFSEEGYHYKLRSPMLESAIYDDLSGTRDYSFLNLLSKSLWLFSIIFFFYGCRELYVGFAKDLYLTVLVASIYFLVAVFCMIVPLMVSLFVRIEETMFEVYKEHSSQDDFS